MYYLHFNNGNMFSGRTLGPMSLDEVFAYPVEIDTPVCVDGGQWMPLSSYPELMLAMQQRRGVDPQTYNAAGYNAPGYYDPAVNSKKTLCGIMAILFGGLGIQYFILGKVGAGLLTILFSIISCGLWPIVMLVQGIVMLCMPDQQFEQKFMRTSSFFPLF